MPIVSTDEEIREILSRFRRIAVVGFSDNPGRPSHGVATFLQRQGYDIWPVNPRLAGEIVLGRRVCAALRELPEVPEIVDVFRRSECVWEVAEQAIAVGAQVLWTQLGVRDDAAAQRASAVGLAVVQERCPAIEIPRLRIGLAGPVPFL